MTHDELLAKIDRYAKGASMLDSKAWAALRAVVKLHQPLNEEMSFCVSCQTSYNGEPDVVVWPCPLIKIIEKELA